MDQATGSVLAGIATGLGTWLAAGITGYFLLRGKSVEIEGLREQIKVQRDQLAQKRDTDDDNIAKQIRDELRLENKELRDEIRSLRDEVVKLRAEIRQHQDGKERAERECDAHRERADHLESQLGELRTMLDGVLRANDSFCIAQRERERILALLGPEREKVAIDA